LTKDPNVTATADQVRNVLLLERGGKEEECDPPSHKLQGFFGDCSDVSFGATNLNSQLDCAFNNEEGEACLAAVILACIAILSCVFCCIRRRNQKREYQVN
jgi:hypothetical protein